MKSVSEFPGTPLALQPQDVISEETPSLLIDKDSTAVVPTYVQTALFTAAKLSKREIEIALYIALGKSDKEIEASFYRGLNLIVLIYFHTKWFWLCKNFSIGSICNSYSTT